ncbi:uncharacterized protein LOC135462948 [Liolophura sinensis]|uniref:uncharacterized protein LOC135462948 n=1 Tax=Liolophura sinensis TaxID=3198878 RepID=UPI0031597111
MLLYRISMKLRRHLFAACLLLCTAIFVLSYMGLHNGRSTNLKPIREKMEWFKERKFLANDNITSAIREITSVLEDDNPFNKSRRLNAVAGKEKFSARLPSVSRDKEDTSKSQSVPLSSATQVRLIAGANRVDAVNRHSNISQIVLSDAETATPASKLRGESELHQGPLKTKQLQGSIQRQHELFIKAYKDLQHRNELLEKGVTQERRQQQQPPQGRDSNGGQSRKELSKNKTDLHEGSKQSFNTINKIRGGKFDEQNQAIDVRGSRFRDGSAKQEERGLRIMEQSGSQHLHGNSIKKDQSSSINALRGDSKIRDQRGSVIGLQSDFNIRDRVGQINGINGEWPKEFFSNQKCANIAFK